jgi:transposase
VVTCRQALLGTLAHEQAKLTAPSREVFQWLSDKWQALEQRRADDHEQLESMCQAHPVDQRLLTVPGMVPLTATALVAAVSDATHVRNGRLFAA